MSEEDHIRPHIGPVRDRAIELLTEVGWTKNAFIRDADGQRMDLNLNWEDYPITGIACLCLVGAVVVSCREMKIDPYSTTDLFSDLWKDYNDKHGTELDEFNDDKNTTLEDVIQSLKKMEPMMSYDSLLNQKNHHGNLADLYRESRKIYRFSEERTHSVFDQYEEGRDQINGLIAKLKEGTATQADVLAVTERYDFLALKNSIVDARELLDDLSVSIDALKDTFDQCLDPDMVF